LNDAAKYLKAKSPTPSGIDELRNTIDPIEILKKGFVNLARGADFSKLNVNRLLTVAATEGWNVAGVQILVGLGAHLHEKENPAIMFAAENGHEDIVSTLISLGSSVKCTTSTKKTPLHWATINGHENCVRVLLDAGSNVRAKSTQGKSALDYALLKKEENYKSASFQRIVKMLKGEKLEPLEQLCKECKPFCNVCKSTKESSFNKAMQAAVEGSLAKFFDNHEMDLSTVSELLTTPAAVSKLENVTQLLYFGANVRHISGQGLTPLLLAAIYGNPATVTALLDAGSELEFRAISGSTALSRASEGGTLSVLETILAARADVNAKNNYGYTPLLIAVRYNTAKHVIALLEAGSDISTMTNDGGVFDLVNFNKNKEEVLPVLKKYKAKLRNNGSIFGMRRWFNSITNETVSRSSILTEKGEALLF